MVGNFHIVTQVYTIHQIVFVAYLCVLSFVRSSADDYILADIVFVADNEQCMLTCIMEVLRFTS